LFEINYFVVLIIISAHLYFGNTNIPLEIEGIEIDFIFNSFDKSKILVMVYLNKFSSFLSPPDQIGPTACKTY